VQTELFLLKPQMRENERLQHREIRRREQQALDLYRQRRQEYHDGRRMRMERMRVAAERVVMNMNNVTDLVQPAPNPALMAHNYTQPLPPPGLTGPSVGVLQPRTLPPPPAMPRWIDAAAARVPPPPPAALPPPWIPHMRIQRVTSGVHRGAAEDVPPQVQIPGKR
jgi:hypothetical protein